MCFAEVESLCEDGGDGGKDCEDSVERDMHGHSEELAEEEGDER